MTDFTETGSASGQDSDSDSSTGLAPEDIIAIVDGVVRMSVILCTGK